LPGRVSPVTGLSLACATLADPAFASCASVAPGITNSTIASIAIAALRLDCRRDDNLAAGSGDRDFIAADRSAHMRSMTTRIGLEQSEE
jgi:hypothetical protein